MKITREEIVEMVRDKYGLKDGVKFNLSESQCNPFYFKDDVLYDCDGDVRRVWNILDNDNIEVIKEPLLTDEEIEKTLKEFKEV